LEHEIKLKNRFVTVFYFGSNQEVKYSFVLRDCVLSRKWKKPY